MKWLLLAQGTRGDVQPIIALGKALKARGHSVRLLASPEFATWIEAHGLEAAPAQVNIQTVMRSEGGQEWVERGNNLIHQMRNMRRLLAEYGLPMIQDAWQASQDAEAVISSFTSVVYTIPMAQRLGIPHRVALLQPSLLATRDGRAMINPICPERLSWLNYLFAKLLIEPASWLLYGDITNQFRVDTLGLPPQNARQFVRDFVQTPILLGYSPRVAPFPAEWPAHFTPTGYWFLHEGQGWEPPADLAAFLAAGEPPVYIGFGSMTGRDAPAISRLVLDAVQQSGCRALLHTGWAGLGADDLPPTVLKIGSVPHDWLFPRMSAVVHHGGAGTTAMGLAAGVPTIVIPHMADQPFWGRRVQALGVGPAPIPRPRLSSKKLANAIRQATTDARMRQKAARLGEEIRAEDGLAKAMEILARSLSAPSQ